MTTAAVLLITTLVLTALMLPALRRARDWRATVTPLASIIGSGFLVVAPLLTSSFGNYAVLAMLLIVITAYGLGDAMRYNILHVEPLLIKQTPPLGLAQREQLSRVVLAFAYVVSVSFYLQLLAAFVLEALPANVVLSSKSITGGILLVIGVLGIWRGLQMLESLEKYAVSVKLAIIAGLLAGLLSYDLSLLSKPALAAFPSLPIFNGDSVRSLLGMLIIVQGFETSRYLGDEYSAATRVSSMRRAQRLSSLIYLLFIILILPVAGLQQGISETAIIQFGAQISWVLPPLLIIAALMSQFSAAVADTIGGGGLFSEATHSKIPPRRAYLLVTALALAITLLTNIFEVISLASRAFALYYLLQCIDAVLIAHHRKDRRRSVIYGLLALIMLAVALFGIPAE
ncbi:MAG: hypothetical protein P1U47_03240 [Zhongshania sp.]|uniref:hypothetical protein n=1 Tax=Zhongshania sp. TaxID=1971902 RepID=UPI00260279E0|nr:hypothetical protein [Zhongshania sp.]MDF1691362.1 hypothetical protein [Zhongshania sp.]